MNAFSFAVRSNDANARILKSITDLAGRYGVGEQVAALAEVKDKDPQVEQVKRLEALAGVLEKIIAHAPIIQTHADSKPTAEPKAETKPDDKTLRKGKR